MASPNEGKNYLKAKENMRHSVLMTVFLACIFDFSFYK
jgi:hypothetical protein